MKPLVLMDLTEAAGSDSRIHLGSILGDLDNFTRYGVFADFLGDNNFRPPFVYALQWMHRRQKRPIRREYIRGIGGGRYNRKVPEKYSWAWYRLDRAPLWINEDPVATIHNCLPRSVMPFTVGQRKLYPSLLEAVDDLAKWLDAVRIGYSLEMPA